MERELHERIEIDEETTRTNGTSHKRIAVPLELVPQILVRVMLGLVAVLLAT